MVRAVEFPSPRVAAAGAGQVKAVEVVVVVVVVVVDVVVVVVVVVVVAAGVVVVANIKCFNQKNKWMNVISNARYTTRKYQTNLTNFEN